MGYLESNPDDANHSIRQILVYGVGRYLPMYKGPESPTYPTPVLHSGNVHHRQGGAARDSLAKRPLSLDKSMKR